MLRDGQTMLVSSRVQVTLISGSPSAQSGSAVAAGSRTTETGSACSASVQVRAAGAGVTGASLTARPPPW